MKRWLSSLALLTVAATFIGVTPTVLASTQYHALAIKKMVSKTNRSVKLGSLEQWTLNLANKINHDVVFQQQTGPTKLELAKFKSWLPYWEQAQRANADDTSVVQIITNIVTDLKNPTKDNIMNLLDSLANIEAQQGFNPNQVISLAQQKATHVRTMTFGHLAQETGQLASAMANSNPSAAQQAKLKSLVPFWKQAEVENVKSGGIQQMIAGNILPTMNMITSSNMDFLSQWIEQLEMIQGFKPNLIIKVSTP